MLPFLSTRLTGGQEGNDVKRLVPYCAAPVDGAIFPMMTLRLPIGFFNILLMMVSSLLTMPLHALSGCLHYAPSWRSVSAIACMSRSIGKPTLKQSS